LSVKALRFPGEFPWDPNGGAARSIDALGLPNGGGAPGAVRETFSPRYDAYLPELPLAAIGPKPLFRDLAPFETIGEHGERHGRSVAPLELWVSAYNLNVGSATALGYALPPALLERVKAKSVLRAAAAFVGKGASALVYYAPDDSDLALYDPAAPGGGAALRALARLTGAFAGAELDAATRTLSLVSIGGCPRREEWSGDGTAEHPSLYDHDVLAFLPFQLAERRFAVAAYVMTRNVLATRDPRRAADDPARFDLAPARYRLTVRGLGPAASVRAIDPLPDVPAAAGSAATIVGRVGDATVVDAELTDAPRLLLFED
jgi:hypothetical protein